MREYLTRPNSPDCPEKEEFDRGVALYHAGRYHDAGAVFETLDRQYAPHWPARLAAASLLYHCTSDAYHTVQMTDGSTTTPWAIVMGCVREYPRWADALATLGAFALDRGDFLNAYQFALRATNAVPTHAIAWSIRAQAAIALRRKYRPALAKAARLLAASSPTLWVERARIAAYLGEDDGAYALYEQRWHLPGYASDMGAPDLPLWQPEERVPHMVIVAEQGAGDVIQYARYIPMLRRYAERLTLRLRHNGLLPLIRYWLPWLDVAPNVPSDATHWYPLLSSRLLFGRSNPLPLGIVEQSEPCIAFVWAGNPQYKRDRIRSLTHVEASELAARLRDAVPAAQLIDLTLEHPVLDGVERYEPEHYLDTALFLARVAIVVTVDTSVLHLAGTLGKPTIGILGALPDWRWGLSGESTYWYPSVRLVRQRRDIVPLAQRVYAAAQGRG